MRVFIHILYLKNGMKYASKAKRADAAKVSKGQLFSSRAL